jgi:hypothetical protein
MSVNRNRPDLWKDDIVRSVDLYNSWFMEFAPKAFRESRLGTSKRVAEALSLTNNMTTITPELLYQNPYLLPILRMSTCPPIVRDRLIGLAGVSRQLIEKMETSLEPQIKSLDSNNILTHDLDKICNLISKMVDYDIFKWLKRKNNPTKNEIMHSIIIIADRLSGIITNPIIRNAQEKRQLTTISDWLIGKNYTLVDKLKYNELNPGNFSFKKDIPVSSTTSNGEINYKIQIDTIIMPLNAKYGQLPLLIEAKSAGDYVNVNKRRKEEAQKMSKLKTVLGNSIKYVLFLCGYFDSAYLGYEAAEGIDWVWEHRIDDLTLFGL